MLRTGLFLLFFLFLPQISDSFWTWDNSDLRGLGSLSDNKKFQTTHEDGLDNVGITNVLGTFISCVGARGINTLHSDTSPIVRVFKSTAEELIQTPLL